MEMTVLPGRALTYVRVRAEDGREGDWLATREQFLREAERTVLSELLSPQPAQVLQQVTRMVKFSPAENNFCCKVKDFLDSSCVLF